MFNKDRVKKSILDELESDSVSKERIYIDDPSEAPESANVEEGERGGYYYETGSTDDDLGPIDDVVDAVQEIEGEAGDKVRDTLQELEGAEDENEVSNILDQALTDLEDNADVDGQTDAAVAHGEIESALEEVDRQRATGGDSEGSSDSSGESAEAEGDIGELQGTVDSLDIDEDSADNIKDTLDEVQGLADDGNHAEAASMMAEVLGEVENHDDMMSGEGDVYDFSREVNEAVGNLYDQM